MIGKLIAFAPTRDECLERMRRALNEFVVDGVATTIPLHQKLASAHDIIQGRYNIHWLTRNLDVLNASGGKAG